MQQDEMLGYLKVLADASRLRILGVLANHPASVEEIAVAVKLKTPTVSHHLTKLKQFGLIRMEADGTTHIYHLNAGGLEKLNRNLQPEQIRSWGPVESNYWEAKILHDFVDGETLKEIPASRKKRQVILAWLVGKFAADARYPESQVNEIIGRHHPDFATLRRELIASKLMARDNGVYWRL